MAGFAFNGGPVALAGAAIVFVAVGLVEARRHVTPGRVGAWRKALGTVAAVALLAASFGLFFLSEVSRWERSAGDYASSPQEPGKLLRVGEGGLKELTGAGGGTLVATHERSDVMDWPKIYRVRMIFLDTAK